jgi:Family of unknown function (DUF5329)
MSGSWKLLAVAACLALLPSAAAAPPAAAQDETAFLLGLVEGSDCDFYRNGTRYDGARASSHLRDKFAVAVASGNALTADTFIEKVASTSSVTGRPYEVSCAGHERESMAAWLRAALASYRENRAPRAARGAQ